MTDKIIRIRLDAAQANRDITQLDSGMRRAGGAADGLQTAVTRVAAAVATAFSTRQIVAYADAFTNIQNRIRVVASSTEELTQKTAELLSIANDTRSSYETTAVLFSRLAQSTTELGVSQERLLAITSTINKSFAVSGASAVEASNAIRQLSQGLAAGALRGDEFNSVAEQAPEILRAVAKETGLAYGELREFAATGGITSKILISAIENYADTVDKSFAKTNRTFEQSLQIAKNNATAFIGANEQVQSAASAAGNAVVALSNNIDTLGEGLILIAAIVAGRYLTAIGASIAASAQQLIANQRLAASEIALAQAVNQRAIQEQLAAQRALANATTTELRSRAITQAAIANQAAIASTNALTAAQARYNAVAGAGIAVTRGLSGAMAFLGGPLGVVLLAASAIAIFASNARDAAATGLKEEIDEQIVKFRELNAEGKKLSFTKLANEQVLLSAELRKATEEAERLRVASEKAAENRGFAAGAGALAAYAKQQAVVAALNDRLNKLTATQTALFEDGLPAITASTAATNDNADAVGRLGDNLDALRKVGAGIDSLFSGEFNLFGDSGDNDQTDEQQARIAKRLSDLRLETQTISSEYAVRQAIRQGAFTAEDGELAIQTARKIQRAVEERELLLAEQNITNEQKLETERLFREQLAEIDLEYNTKKTDNDAILARMIEESNQSVFLSNISLANSGLSIVESVLGKSSKLLKAARLGLGIVNAYAIYANASSAAIAALSPVYGLGPIAGKPLAAATLAAGKASAASVLAGAVGSTFSTSGSSGISSVGGGGSGAAAVAQPTIPTSSPLVGRVEITGLNSLVDELRNSDAQLPATYVARILDAVQSANRLRGDA